MDGECRRRRTRPEAVEQVGKLLSTKRRWLVVGRARRVRQDVRILRQDAQEVNDLLMEKPEWGQGVVEEDVAKCWKEHFAEQEQICGYKWWQHASAHTVARVRFVSTLFNEPLPDRSPLTVQFCGQSNVVISSRCSRIDVHIYKNKTHRRSTEDASDALRPVVHLLVCGRVGRDLPEQRLHALFDNDTDRCNQ